MSAMALPSSSSRLAFATNAQPRASRSEIVSEHAGALNTIAVLTALAAANLILMIALWRLTAADGDQFGEDADGDLGRRDRADVEAEIRKPLWLR